MDKSTARIFRQKIEGGRHSFFLRKLLVYLNLFKEKYSFSVLFSAMPFHSIPLIIGLIIIDVFQFKTFRVRLNLIMVYANIFIHTHKHTESSLFHQSFAIFIQLKFLAVAFWLPSVAQPPFEWKSSFC